METIWDGIAHSIDAWVALGLGYLCGSIPFGLLLTRLAGLGDIRDVGSGNIGATNVLRTGRKGLAVATLLLDGLKGALPVLVAGRFSVEAAVLGGAGAFLGHLFPVWLNFRGGKGVATFIGVTAALSLKVAAAFGVTWLLVAVLTRYSSLAALVATALTPVFAALTGRYDLAAVAVAMGLLIFVRHEANIGRLMRGEETKIGGTGK